MIDIEIIGHINAAFGRCYPAEKYERWSTDVVSVGRTSQRNQMFSQPQRSWVINYEALDSGERDALLELFRRAHGALRTFKIADDDDYHCSVAECSITAAAGDTTTQLIKSYYPSETETWNEDRTCIRPSGVYSPSIYIDGAAKTEDTHFTLDDDTGIIDWSGGGAPNGAMAGGEVITADYQFYFQVRFDIDTYTDIRNVPDYWQYNGIRLVEDE